MVLFLITLNLYKTILYYLNIIKIIIKKKELLKITDNNNFNL